jgi:MFS transporter, ACS family, pantothenate transporter
VPTKFTLCDSSSVRYCRAVLLLLQQNSRKTGLAESTFYPGMQYIIGSWYRKDELAKRSCIFHTSSGLGAMFSGYLMAGVYNLGGKGGYKGWQWYDQISTETPNRPTLTPLWILACRLFIIDGVISLPVALAGFFVLPDVPEISKPWYLSKKVSVVNITLKFCCEHTIDESML